MEYETIEDSYQEEFLSALQKIDDDLTEKRERFIYYLQATETELQRNPNFISFLIYTKDELLESATRLNSIVRNMAWAILPQKHKTGEFMKRAVRLNAKAGTLLA